MAQKKPAKKKSAKKKAAKTPAKEKPDLGRDVEQAMQDAAVEDRDERGLVPLTDARRIVQQATAFERGELAQVTDADRLWAALLSLEDAAELCREATRLVWKFHPRGKENRALVERYGDDVLDWIASRVSDGVLTNFPWCIDPCLIAIGSEAAFELIWSLRGYDDSTEMSGWEVQPAREVPREELEQRAEALCSGWISAHPAVGLKQLAQRANAGDARAAALLSRRARVAPRTFQEELARAAGKKLADELAEKLEFPRSLTEEAVLSVLDDAAFEGKWPLFYYQADSRLEYFAMRLVVARAKQGDGWGIVFQRLTGSYPEALRIEQLAYGSEVTDPFVESAQVTQIDWEGNGFHGGVVSGWAEDITLDEGWIDEHDLRFGRSVEVGYHPYRVAVIRAYLAAHPDPWPDPDEAIPVLGLENAEVLLVSDGFQHVIGPNGRKNAPEQPWEVLPGDSSVFQSLARAIVARDNALFVPGESNLDWRLHAFSDEDVPPPWLSARFEPPGLASAMQEAGIDGDRMPLELARKTLDGATRFERGQGQRVGGHWVQGSDRLWAALLSLESGQELRERGKLEWTLRVRRSQDHENTAVAERYGKEALAWMHHFVKDGVLHDLPGCLRASLLAIDDDAALALLLTLDGFEAPDAAGTPETQRAVVLDAWLERAPTRLRSLVRLASDEPRARALLQTRALLEDMSAVVQEVTGDLALLDALEIPKELSPAHVLARLDRAAGRPAEEPAHWPRFFYNAYPGIAEYHGLRLFAARQKNGDRWAIVIERLTGYNPIRVRQYHYGSAVDGHVETADRELVLAMKNGKVEGPAGQVAFDAEEKAMLTEPPDYWGAREAQGWIQPQRAYLAVHSPFTDADELKTRLELDEVIADTTEFSHVDGPNPPGNTERRAWHVLPSQSRAYQTLAEAIATREPGRFDPGEPNTDYRIHAIFSPDQ